MKLSRGPQRERELIEETLRGVDKAIREAQRETSRLLEAAREGRRYAARTRRRLTQMPDPAGHRGSDRTDEQHRSAPMPAHEHLDSENLESAGQVIDLLAGDRCKNEPEALSKPLRS
jgi:hypothetical protein